MAKTKTRHPNTMASLPKFSGAIDAIDPDEYPALRGASLIGARIPGRDDKGADNG